MVIRAIVLAQRMPTAFIPGAVMAAGTHLVLAAVMNMAVPLPNSYLMGIITKKELGFASALNPLIWRLPNSVNGGIGATMLDEGGYELPFYIATAFYVTVMSLFHFVFKDIRPGEEPL